jgi:hypothetical protein
MRPTEVLEENSRAIGQMCIDVYGKGWGRFKIAHLSTSTLLVLSYLNSLKI